MYLHLLATVHCPVSAVGKEIRNSFGIIVATCTDSWTATAMAALVNMAVPAAQQEHAAYLATEDRKAALLRRGEG
jgi:hypothetical protein